MFASLWLVPLCLAAVVVQVSAAPSSSPSDDVAKRGGHHHQQSLQQQDAHTSGHHRSSPSKRGGHHHQQQVLQHDARTSGHNGSSTNKRGTECPDSWTSYNRVTCSCYMFVNTLQTYYQAKVKCRAYGAQSKLVEITSAEENEFVTLLASTDKTVWTGINDIAVEDRWVLPSSGYTAVYFNWAPREPSNYLNREDCVEFYGNNGKWNDWKCSGSTYFMCEMRVC